MPRKPISQKTEGFTKQVNLWMRPAALKALKHRAVDEDVPVQTVVDRAVTYYLETAPAVPETATA